MSRLYQVHEFAALAGVTVKALHHYHRVGLLEPRRTDAGYRVYTVTDLERLEQIVALKFIGLPLKHIKRLLDRDVLELPYALRLQRKELEQKRRLIDRAISAIQDAEKLTEPGKPVDSLSLKKILEVIGMQSNTDFMRKYYSEETWAQWRKAHDHWPSEEWIELLSDIEAELGEEPQGERAQALVARWIELRHIESGGDPAQWVGSMKTWADRQNWPPVVYRRFARFDLEAIARFMDAARSSNRKKYYSDEAWAKMQARATPRAREQESLEWFDLYLEAGALVGEDPSSEKAQALAERWMDMVHRTTAGDPEIRAGGLRAFADRQNWSAAIRREIASFNLEEIGRFIAKANARYQKKYYSDKAWAHLAELQKQSTSESRRTNTAEWVALYGDVRTVLDEDPASENAQALAERWMSLVETSSGGDPEVKAGMTKAWLDRDHWPSWTKREIEASNLESISKFIGQALDVPLKKYFSEEAFSKRTTRYKRLAPAELQLELDARAELFRDIQAALEENPSGARAQILAKQWLELRSREAGGDPEVLAAKNKAWADRHNWPLALRVKEAASYKLTLENFEKAADFINEAVSKRS